MASRVRTGDAFSRERPRRLFDLPGFVAGNAYDVAVDGTRFVVKVKNPDAPAREIHVVLNWFEELRRLAGEAGTP